MDKQEVDVLCTELLATTQIQSVGQRCIQATQTNLWSRPELLLFTTAALLV